MTDSDFEAEGEEEEEEPEPPPGSSMDEEYSRMALVLNMVTENTFPYLFFHPLLASLPWNVLVNATESNRKHSKRTLEKEMYSIISTYCSEDVNGKDYRAQYWGCANTCEHVVNAICGAIVNVAIVCRMMGDDHYLETQLDVL